MRLLGLAVLALSSCSRGPQRVPSPPNTEATADERAEPGETTGRQPSKGTRLTSDTPTTTVAGHTFIAPAGWSMSVRGRATIVTVPEGDSHIAFVDVRAKDAPQAVATAWAEYGHAKRPPLEVVERRANRDGWTDIHAFEYQAAPNEKRVLLAEARRAGNGWLVILGDASNAAAQKRASEFYVMLDRLFPKGYMPESFAGRTANRLEDPRVVQLVEFVETARTQLGVPGVSLGIVQDGKVVFLGGFGVRELGKPARVDGDTKFMIASNTKPLTTLMLAKLVDEKRIAWDSPATRLLPSFALGDPDTTAKVQVKHLVCACTGLPRQDFESTFEFGNLTPDTAMAVLATMQPTSEFGELFQYSNPLAAAAGFIGGHVAFPKLELGTAYAKAMRSRVFVPLGMNATTFDHGRAQRGNWARPHAPDIDGVLGPAAHELNTTVHDAPAGGAWSTARDVLAYVQMELAEGLLPNGDRYIAKDPLLARREPQAAMGKNATYGMGLVVETKYDVTVVHHGGALDGYYGDMMWLPKHGVGAVVLTNGDPGWAIHDAFQRKLLEVLFDGKPQADDEVAAATKSYHARLAARRTLLDVPADADVVAGLAPAYDNAALGEIVVRRAKDRVMFDFGEWNSEVTSRKHPDGTISMVIIGLGIESVDFVVGSKAGKRTLTVRDHQHEYVFVER